MNQAITSKPLITKAQAEQLDRKIKAALDAGEKWGKETWALTQDMRNTLGYTWLGFDDFELYMDARTEQYRHLKVSRGQLVLDYVEMGYNQREIAEKLGVSQKTVSNEYQEQVSKNYSTDVPPVINGRDGKSYPRERKQPEPKPVDEKHNRRIHERTGWCSDNDGWKDGYQRLTDRLTVMTRNPTYLQLSQLEKLLVRTLQRVRKMQTELNGEKVAT